jgi:dihydroorotase
MLGLETAFPVVVETMVASGGLDWRGVANRLSERPARIGRLDDQGRPIAVGEPATLVVVDPDSTWEVDPARSASRSANTPFLARTMRGSVVHTVLRGRPTVSEGTLV